jgi:hypothetical protein
MNAWDDGPTDIANNSEAEDDKSDRTPRPCNAILIRESHKRYQQKVWLPMMKEIWNEIDHRTNALIKKENLLIQEIPKVGKENEKRGLPFGLGLLPVIFITDLWRQFKKGEMSKEVAEKEMKCLWARFQFADGFCKLPPTKGGEYPTKADIEDEYRKRTGRDPQTGHRIEQGQQGSKADKARDGPSGKSTDKKRMTDPQAGKKVEGSKTHKKARSQKRPSARKKATESIDSDTEMAEASDDYANVMMTGAYNEESDNPTSHKRSEKRRKRKEHTSQAIVPINPYSSPTYQGKAVQIWTSSQRQVRTFKPGYTSSGHRIIAFGKIEREEIADSGEGYHRTTRNYVVRKGKGSYTIQSESDCGGPEIWELLPAKFKEERRIGQDFDAIPNRRQLPHMRHGISWLAIGKCGAGPSRYPSIACEIFWQHGGQKERRSIIWRTQLHKAFGPVNADWHLGKVITPMGQDPPPNLWTAIRWFQPHIEPTVRVSQKMLPAASSLLLPPPPPHQGQSNRQVGKELSRRERRINSLTRELERLRMETKDLDQPPESGSDTTSAGSSGASSESGSEAGTEAGWESSSDITSDGSSDVKGGSDSESGSEVASDGSSDAESGSDSDESVKSDRLFKRFRALKQKAKENRSKRKGE